MRSRVLEVRPIVRIGAQCRKRIEALEVEQGIIDREGAIGIDTTERQNNVSVALSAERERLAEERKAAEAAERQAKLEAEARASREYLAQIVSGTKLRARTCPGPGYYVVGIRPDIRPRTHSCVDVDFRASCRGSPNTSVRGTIRNFVGISTDCYMGDVVQIEKLACDAQDVVIETLAARVCSFGK